MRPMNAKCRREHHGGNSSRVENSDGIIITGVATTPPTTPNKTKVRFMPTIVKLRQPLQLQKWITDEATNGGEATVIMETPPTNRLTVEGLVMGTTSVNSRGAMTLVRGGKWNFLESGAYPRLAR
jgi:hypothetical protein